MKPIVLCMMVVPVLLLSACSMDSSVFARRAPLGARTLKLANDSIEFALTREGGLISGRSLTNSRTGFNWAAPGASVGPCLTRSGESLAGFDGKKQFCLCRPAAREPAGAPWS